MFGEGIVKGSNAQESVCRVQKGDSEVGQVRSAEYEIEIGLLLLWTHGMSAP